MKRQAFDHTKMNLLMEKLNVPRYVAVGIMESIWYLTAREAPRGDIGKLSNERIAIGIDWRGATNKSRRDEADRLVNALVESGWLDRDGPEWSTNEVLTKGERGTNEVLKRYQYRLVIHDWPEHADDAVKKYLKRNNLTWAVSRHVATNPDLSRLPEDQHPEDLRQTGGATPPVLQMPRQSDFPKTDVAIRSRCPSADLSIVTRITEAAMQAYISVDHPKMAAPTDADIADAVEKAAKDSPKQQGAGLFLRTVPAVIKSWAELGRHPPSGARPLNRYVKPVAPMENPDDANTSSLPRH